MLSPRKRLEHIAAVAAGMKLRRVHAEDRDVSEIDMALT